MTNGVTPQFSRKILFLSLIFVLANLGVYGLRLIANKPSEFQPLAPVLLSATLQDVGVRSPYDTDYRPAREKEEIYAGTSVRTADKTFAELDLGDNRIRLNEQTEVRLVRNDYLQNGLYLPESPRLVLELKSGSIWISAFDPVVAKVPRAEVSLHHGVGMLTYTEPINRLMVITGAAGLSLLRENGEAVSGLTIPLNNQITFVDSQITETYAQLKPSKLKKELKMAALAPEVMADEWVVRNVDVMREESEQFQKNLIRTAWEYQAKRAYEEALTYLTFSPEAARDLAVRQGQTMLSYILGAIQDEKDSETAEKVIGEFSALADERAGDPQFSRLIVRTLYAIEDSDYGSPAYLLKEALIGKVVRREGPYVLGAYLTDLRKALLDRDTKTAEAVAEKWLDGWKPSIISVHRVEFDRQTQILNNTILGSVGVVTPAILGVFDQSGDRAMAEAGDLEETRFEVISNRLQIAASLVSSYRYALAKQYLKDSYLSLNIDNLGPELASTQVFLSTGTLLAQRIEYAEAVLRGAAQPINEEKFREYFQILKRDEALSADLKKFFKLDQGTTQEAVRVTAPTPSEVAGRFLDARINVNFADISLRDEPGFIYDIANARLIDRSRDGKTLSFDAVYDFGGNSVLDIVSNGDSYKGPFTLPDVVILLKEGGILESRIPKPQVEEGVEAYITDQEKIAALEGQAIAQDVARQLAYNQLTDLGMVIPSVKFDIEITDVVNLNQFRIKRALIDRPDQAEPSAISFDYSTVTGEVKNVKSEEGMDLIAVTTATELIPQVSARLTELEKQLKAIGEFREFASSNSLSISSANLGYDQSGLITFKDLELVTLRLKASGTYDPEKKLFVTATNPKLTLSMVAPRDYFKLLADQYVVEYMTARGFSLNSSQVQSRYPFDVIEIWQLNLGGYLFSFTLDMNADRALNIKREGSDVVISELTLEELKLQPQLIQPAAGVQGG